MNSAIRRINWILFKVLILAGCSGQHSDITTDLPSYQKLEKMKLNVAMIRHQELPQDNPQLNAALPWPPPQALKDWAAQRLKAESSEGIAVILLRQYTFQEVSIVPEGNFISRWTNFEKVRLESSMQVAIEIYDAKNNLIGQVEVTPSRSTAYEYELNARDLQGAWRKEMQELLEILDFQMRSLLEPYFVKKP